MRSTPHNVKQCFCYRREEEDDETETRREEDRQDETGGGEQHTAETRRDGSSFSPLAPRQQTDIQSCRAIQTTRNKIKVNEI